MSAEDAAAIDAGIASIMEAHPEVPAIYIGVWDPERGVYQQAYGLADVAGKRPAALEDHFRIGSISKTFMATVILQLIDEGKLALDDTVAAVDPDLASRHPNLAGITIEQLLGMTSGIPDYMNVPDAAVAALTQAPDTVWEEDQLIGFGADGDVQPPGTGGYSTHELHRPPGHRRDAHRHVHPGPHPRAGHRAPGHDRHGPAPQRGHDPARAIRPRLHEPGLRRTSS